MAWRDLSLADRSQVRAEESGEFQAEQQAEAARVRTSAMGKNSDMSNIDTGGLAMLLFEGAATALRKSNPKPFARAGIFRVYCDPKYAVAAKAEREAALGRIAGLTSRGRRRGS